MEPSVSFSQGIAYLHIKKVPFRFISIILSHTSSVTFSARSSSHTPALFTRISILPVLSTAFSTMVLQPAAEETSPCRGKTSPDRLSIDAAAASRVFRFLPAIQTAAPSDANLTAAALPIPLPPPVIRTVLPLQLSTPTSLLHTIFICYLKSKTLALCEAFLLLRFFGSSI